MSFLLMNIASAEKIKPILEKDSIQSKAFMSNLDRLKDSISNITIENTSSQTFTITGIFIQQLFQADCTTSYYNKNGQLYGIIWSDEINFTQYATTPLGAGYLYSMMMNYLYEAATTPSSGLALTTPGNGAGTWCIQLGILQGWPAQYITSSVTTYTTTPSSTLSNVVRWSNNTNPAPIAIICNDGTQQCTATATTTQVFPV